MACHAYEQLEPVHCDAERVHQRELVEHSGGRDADVYGTGKDFSRVMEKHRAANLRRPKGYIFAEKVEEWDGPWLKKLDQRGSFFYCRDRIGHQALGMAVSRKCVERHRCSACACGKCRELASVLRV